MKAKLTYHITPSEPLRGELTLLGDKSISHRAVILGALAQGTTVIKGFLKAQDTLATLRAMNSLGIQIEDFGEETIIHGKGLGGLTPASQPIDCGNSGTAMRLLTGVLAGQPFTSVLTGDESLLRRPMERLIDPLTKMGARISSSSQSTGPLIIQGVNKLSSVQYTMPIASAQVKSCLLLAGLYAEGETVLITPVLTRDHTECLLKAFHYDVYSAGHKIKIKGRGKLHPTYLEIPGDISSAAFFIVAATIIPNSDIWLRNVGINPFRIGIINILRLMGAHISLENETMLSGEYVADIHVRSSVLHGIDIPLDQVPLAIDEFPVIFIAAAVANGLTVLRGAAELHVKETDRIQVMAEGLERLGVAVHATPDGMSIEGGRIKGGMVNSYGDHRVAMSFAIAGAVAEEETTIFDCDNVATSFPNFLEMAQLLGMNIQSARELVSST